MQLYSSCFATYVSESVLHSFLTALLKEPHGTQHLSIREAEQRFDLPESIQRTLLILLENEGAVQIHSDFFNHFTITPYSHETVRTTPHADA